MSGYLPKGLWPADPVSLRLRQSQLFQRERQEKCSREIGCIFYFDCLEHALLHHYFGDLNRIPNTKKLFRTGVEMDLLRDPVQACVKCDVLFVASFQSLLIQVSYIPECSMG